MSWMDVIKIAIAVAVFLALQSIALGVLLAVRDRMQVHTEPVKLIGYNEEIAALNLERVDSIITEDKQVVVSISGSTMRFHCTTKEDAQEMAKDLAFWVNVRLKQKE